MINDIILSRLDKIAGDFDTPFFSYLIYSYGLSVQDCEEIIASLREDIESGEIIAENIVFTLEEYFKSKVADLEKRDKTDYLNRLISPESEFFIKYLKRYGLSDEDIEIIAAKVRDRIAEDNISDFEIKRNLEFYFANAVKQRDYIRKLGRIVGKNYDTLIIAKAKRDYPILLEADIIRIIFEIHGDILDAVEFRDGIKKEFLKRCEIKSEHKKAMAKSALNSYVEGKGDSFSKLVRSKNLSKRDGEIIVSQILADISSGLIQPQDIDGIFLTRRFNEYIENER